MSQQQKPHSGPEEVSSQFGIVLRPVTLDRMIKYVLKIPRHIAILMVGNVAIGKTTTAIEIARVEAERLGKELVILEELLKKAPSKEDRERLLKPIFANPEKYYVVYILKLGGVLPEEILGYPRDETYTYRDPDTGELKTVTAKFELVDTTLLLFTIPKIHGVLILDDVTHIMYPTVESFVATLTQERKLGCGGTAPYLSENVRILATGNLPEHTESAKPLPRHMAGRFSVWYVLPPPIEKWVEIMRNRHGEKFSNNVIAYLLRYKEHFYVPQDIDPVLRLGPCPRAWEKVGEVVWEYENDPNYTMDDIFLAVQSFVGFKYALNYEQFVSKKVPSIEELFEKPEETIQILRKDMDVACRFVTEIASKLELSLSKYGGGTGNETVKIKLPNKKYYVASKADPNIYIYALATVMREVTSDYGIMALHGMGTKAKEALKDFITTELPKSKRPDEEAWIKALTDARSTIYDFLVSIGITRALDQKS